MPSQFKMAGDNQGSAGSSNGSGSGGSSVDRRVLSYEQVCLLQQVVGDELHIPGRGTYPTLTLTARELIEAVRDRLNEAGIAVRDVRINGSAASCVVAGNMSRSYNDLDVLFNLSPPSGPAREDHARHDRVRGAALSALLDFFPEDASRDGQNPDALGEAYVHKKVKIETGADRWSLISLQNNSGCSVELKFVDAMKRKYQFSVDSFQVVIDSFLLYREASPVPMNERFYPTVEAQTFYGDFDAAVGHLERDLIATRSPEEIRGGGLLKYCGLLAKGFKPDASVVAPTLERYMCARFFIDFPNVARQRQQLANHLANHFCGRHDDERGLFLVLVLDVVQRSAFCLPAHERRQTLNLIHQMALAVTFEPEFRAYSKHREMTFFDNGGGGAALNYAYHHFGAASLMTTQVAPPPPGHHHHAVHVGCQCHNHNQLYGVGGPQMVYPVYYSNPLIMSSGPMS